MRLSQFHLSTTKETPADAEIVSHQLMLRAGLIRKLGAGLYTWTPLGLRVMRCVERIVREGNGSCRRARDVDADDPAARAVGRDRPLAEIRRAAAQDQGPQGGRILLRVRPHEEVVTDFARSASCTSYKQLPVNFYQIQTKFRDEIRPRFGVMRAREFIMKDAYSFHLTRRLPRARILEHVRNLCTRIFDAARA